MIDLSTNKTHPDDEVGFCDGILYVIYGEGENPNGEDKDLKCRKITLIAEYDDPISLADISESYPDVVLLIEEDFLHGHVFRYGNHSEDGEMWELVGETIGFA